MDRVTRSFAAVLACCLLAGAAKASPVDRYGITAEEHAACGADAMSLCVSAIPDVDRTLACMKQKVEQLTPGCATVFKAGLKRRRIPL